MPLKMAELFIIINSFDDIIYSKTFNCTDKEYCTMYLIAYSCIDHFVELRKNNEDFFPCIEKHFCWDVTLYFLRNGASFIFVNIQKNIQNIIEFFENIELTFASIFLLPNYNFEKVVKDEKLDSNVDKFYLQYFK